MAAEEPALLTVAQRDNFRSVRAPRSADVSADGQLVAFESLARLVPADTDDCLDIYVLDRATRRVTLESEVLGDGAEHSHPRISGDGRYLVFESRPPITHEHPARRHRPARSDRGNVASADDDRAEHRSLRVEPRPRHQRRRPGGGVLVGGNDADRRARCQRRDRRRLRRAGVERHDQPRERDLGRRPARSRRQHPAEPQRGRTMAGICVDGSARRWPRNRDRATNVHDRSTCATPLAAGQPASLAPPTAAFPTGTSWLPSLSADGRRLAFASDASNLLDDDNNRAADVFLYDREADAITWVSRARGRVAGGRREHRAGHLWQRPVRRVPVGRREPGRARGAVPSTPRTSTFSGTCSCSIRRAASSCARAKTSSADGWNRAPVPRSTRPGASSRSRRVTRSMPAIGAATSICSSAPLTHPPISTRKITLNRRPLPARFLPPPDHTGGRQPRTAAGTPSQGRAKSLRPLSISNRERSTRGCPRTRRRLHF